jgi:hypothetical protein
MLLPYLLPRFIFPLPLLRRRKAIPCLVNLILYLDRFDARVTFPDFLRKVLLELQKA